jgi:uncharacterized membrane protein YeaQ/YmgE (transglycosylase-associated protein family)
LAVVYLASLSGTADAHIGTSPKEAGMIGALILGVLAGALARLLIPNDAFEHLEGWRSWLVTIGLGLIGAFVGWLIFAGLFGIGDDDAFDLGGIVGAIIGSILVLLAVGWVLRRTQGSSDRGLAHRRDGFG